MLSLLIFWMCLGCVPGGEWVGVYIPLCTCWGQRTISISQFSSSTLFNWDGVSFCRSVERNRVAGFRTSGDSTVSALNLVAGVLTDEPWTLWAQTLTLKQWVLTLLVQLATLKELPSSSPWLLLEQTRKNSAYCDQVQEQFIEVETTKRSSTMLKWNMCLIMDLSVLR